MFGASKGTLTYVRQSPSERLFRDIASGPTPYRGLDYSGDIRVFAAVVETDFFLQHVCP